VLKVYEASAKAVTQCKEQEGPVFIECITYRLRGHVGPDDNIQGSHTDIRSEAEIDEWKKKDPLDNFKQYLIDEDRVSDSELNQIEEDIVKDISDAYAFTQNSPYPSPGELTRYVYKS